MYMSIKVLEALATLRAAAENDFEHHRLDVLIKDLTAPPVVEKIDDTHQKFLGMIYHKNKTGHFTRHKSIQRDIWIYSYGDIPDGYAIHHIDEDKSNNNISNFQMMTIVEHAHIHNVKREPQKKVCPVCGKIFIPSGVNVNCCSLSCGVKYRWQKTHPKTEKICPTCGKKFIPNYPKKIYCSKECFFADIRSKSEYNVEKKCPVCGKPFLATRLRKLYCSQKCANYANSQKRRKEIKGRICVICGKLFLPHRPNQRCCSVQCVGKLNSRKNPPKQRVCLCCGKEFIIPYNNPKQIYCSRTCARKEMYKNSRIEKTCPICGEKFTVRKSKNNQECCSLSCSAKLRWQRRGSSEI